MPKLRVAGNPAKRTKRRTESSRVNGQRRAVPVAPKGRPTILPSQSVHHCTPPVVAEGVVYPVLGDPVDLDPCSNERSIIRARRVVILPEDGLAIPWLGTVYVNPPYGCENLLEWVKKIIIENRRNGAQVIALLPANVSAEWFDLVVATARACFLWGPGVGGRRLKFIGSKDSAAFHSALAYWGDDLPCFTRHALRYCHPWFPEHDLRLARTLMGDVRDPEGVALPMAMADELLALSRNDDIAAALAALGSATLGDIIDNGDSCLLGRIRQLCAYELGTALLYASRSNAHAWLDQRIPRLPADPDPRQLFLPAPDSHEPKDDPEPSNTSMFIEQVYAAIRHGTIAENPVTSQSLLDTLGCTKSPLRKALDELRKADKVVLTGRGRGARYFSTGERSS